MRRFRFPLERVLEIRELKTLMAEERLALAAWATGEAEARLRESSARRNLAMEQMRAAVTGPVRSFHIVSHSLYLSSVSDEVLSRARELDERREAENQCRQMVVAARKDEQILKKYRNKLFRQYRALYWKEDTKRLDEIATQRFNRKERR